jgi:uncharacterized membrane protein YqjE
VSGLQQSLRRLADTAVGILQVRLELLASELEQEKLRLLDALLKAALGLLMLGLALVLGIGFVVLLFQEGYRLPAVGLMTLAFGAAGVALLRWARRDLSAGPDGLLPLTLGELRQDRAALAAAAPGGDDKPPPAPPPPG